MPDGKIKWTADEDLAPLRAGILADERGFIAEWRDGAWRDVRADYLGEPLQDFEESKAWRFGGDYGQA